MTSSECSCLLVRVLATDCAGASEGSLDELVELQHQREHLVHCVATVVLEGRVLEEEDQIGKHLHF